MKIGELFKITSKQPNLRYGKFHTLKLIVEVITFGLKSNSFRMTNEAFISIEDLYNIPPPGLVHDCVKLNLAKQFISSLIIN